MSDTPTPTAPIAEHTPVRDCSFGDLIIRSSDGMAFRIARETIAKSSPTLFNNILSPPEAEGNPSDCTVEEPIMDVEESGEVWERILHMCHHPPEPTFDYTHIQSLLEASKKYSITAVKERMDKVLRDASYLDAKPVSVYALACAYGLPEVARLAARRTLCLGPVFEYVPELAAISGRAYHYLLEYRQNCSVAARRVVSRSATQAVPAWVGEDEIKHMLVCSREECESTAQYYYTRETDYHIRPAWLEYLGNVERGLEMRPDASIATRTEMLEPVMVSAAECVACARKIFGQAMAFSKEVEARIEAEISTVGLRL